MKPIPFAPGLPWVGIAHDLMRDPLTTVDRLTAQYDQIVRARFLGQSLLLVTHPDLVRAVLVTQAQRFRKADQEVKLMGRFLGNGLVTNNDPVLHRRQRRLVQPAFHMRRITQYANTIVAYTQATLAGWYAGQLIDISAAMRELTMMIVAKSLFNADRDSLSGAAAEIGRAIAIFQQVTDEDFGVLPLNRLFIGRRRKAQAAKQFVDRTLLQIIDDRRANPRDEGDLLSMLLLAQDEDGSSMSDQQLLDEVITLFLAGHETTSNALTWTWTLLAKHPHVAAQMHAELDAVLHGRPPTVADLDNLPYTLMVIKEAMRVYPPIYALNGRVSNEDLQLGDYLIPRNSFVLIAPWGLHHDQRWFPEPQRFDPQRFAPQNEALLPRYAYLPFGAGPRVCIGAGFAMMEAHLIVATIAQQVQPALLPQQKIDLLPQITLSNRGGMYMRIVPRQSLAATPL